MKTLLVLLLLSAQFSAFSQLKNEQKIEAVYGAEWLNRMKSDNPELLDLMDKYVEFGFSVQTTSPGKYSEVSGISTVPLTSKNNEDISIPQFLQEVNQGDLNPLRYRFFPTNEYQVIKLDGVDKIIYILPQDLILSK